MAEQSFQNHAHRPTHTGDRRLVRAAGADPHGADDVLRRATCATGRSSCAILAVFVLVAISRVYTVQLQDRIIMLEDEGARRRAAARRPGRAAREAVEQADCRAALCVGRGVRRAARARGAREPVAEGHQGRRQDLASGPASHLTKAPAGDPGRTTGSPRLIDAHEHTLQVCRACAETTRDLAWEVKRGSIPSAGVAGRDARRSRARARRHRPGRNRDRRDEGGALVSDVPSSGPPRRARQLQRRCGRAGQCRRRDPVGESGHAGRARLPRRGSRRRAGHATWSSRSIATRGRRWSRGLFDDPATPARGAFRCRHQDGSVRWTEGVARNLLQEPRVGGIVVYYRDVTARKATEAAAEGHRRSIWPPVLRRGRHHLRSRCRGLFPVRQSADAAGVRVRRGRGDRPPVHRVHSRRLPPADPAALLPADAASGCSNSYVEFPAVTKSGREVWLGQNAWIISDAAGQAASACRRWRATSPSGAAPKTRCAPPKRSTAPWSNSR